MTTTTKQIPDALKLIKPCKIWALCKQGDKKPYNAYTGQYASVSNPGTWADATTAETMADKYNYAGYHVVTGCQIGTGTILCAMDLDHCIDSQGNLHPEAQKIIEEMNTYTEISQSGTGIHLLFITRPDPRMKAIGKAPDVFGAGTALEVFTSSHFCGVTGNVYREPRTIALRISEPWEIYTRYGIEQAPPEEQNTGTGEILSPTADNAQKGAKQGYKYADSKTDAQIIEKACQTSQDFAELWAGNTMQYAEDHSRADMALCGQLAYWCNADPVRIDKLFRQSGLMRDKWDRKAGRGMTYGQGTIKEALKGITKYVPEDPQQPDPDIKKEPAATPISMKNYLAFDFLKDVQRFKACEGITTGITALDDEIGSLYAGLYTVSASPGCGKSTLVLNIAQNIARAGTPVLYFSMEMSPFELVSKVISRYSATEHGINTRTAMTALQIMQENNQGKAWDVIDRIPQAVTENLHIVPSEMNMTIDRIIETCEQFQSEQEPVIVLDYVQIIQPADVRMNERESIDYTVRRLKQYQMKHNAVVLAVSSTARSNYYSTGGMDAGKGSGTLEYSSNYVWGLQYSALEEIEKNNNNRRDNNNFRQTIRQEAMKNPRELTLTCSKARNGRSGWEVKLDFYPALNYFIGSKSK